MKHRIDPKVDCVFKALLGSMETRNLLIHFLNALLDDDLAAPISEVELLNPYNDKEMLDDKINIVDVKAKDSQGNVYQVEIQMLNHRYLAERMVYTWADLYSQQLKEGQKYGLLKPTYSVWILAQDLFKQDARYLHAYQWRDDLGQCLVEQGGIWVVELNKFSADRIDTELNRWLTFLKTGNELDDTSLPIWMTTPEMEQAMTVLKRFSDKERDYHAYQARQNYLRVQAAFEDESTDLREELRQIKIAIEQQRIVAEQQRIAAEQQRIAAEQEKAAALQREQQAEQEKAAALQREQQTLAEIERLKSLLNPMG